MTTGGWIGEILALRREDVDWKTGTILTQAGDNKGKRDDLDHLPEVALDHLKLVASFEPCVFTWPHHRRTLDVEFHKIQRAAGINLTPEIDLKTGEPMQWTFFWLSRPEARLRHAERR